jgi:hypothetical protein
MNTVILRTRKRTKSNSFSDALFRTLAVADLVTINYVNKYVIVNSEFLVLLAS